MSNHKILEFYGIENQLNKRIEEAKEIIEATQFLLDSGFTKENIEHWLQEKADNENMDEQIMIYINKYKLYENPEAFVYCTKIKKQERQIKRIEEEIRMNNLMDWIRNLMDKLNDGLYAQGETPSKYFGDDKNEVNNEL